MIPVKFLIFSIFSLILARVSALDPEGQTVLKWYQTSETASDTLPTCNQLFINRYYPRDSVYAVNRFDKISYDTLRFSSDITYASDKPGAVPISSATTFVSAGELLIDLDQASDCGYEYTSCDRIGVIAVAFYLRLYTVISLRTVYIEKYTVDEGTNVFSKCAWCINPVCTPKTCEDGQYVTVAAIDRAPFILNRPECKPCKPGTWNSCPSLGSCKWNIPTENVPRDSLGDDIYKFPPNKLIGSCYPCSLIRPNLYYSYGKNTVKTDEFYCPGTTEITYVDGNGQHVFWQNKDPPRDCSSNQVHNTDYTGCSCKPGMYQSPAGCLPCQPGNYCLNGVQTRCPDHYRQENTGATECVKCTDTGEEFGNPVVKCGAGQYMQQCLEGNQQKSVCASCNQCIEKYAHPIVSSSAVRCYT